MMAQVSRLVPGVKGKFVTSEGKAQVTNLRYNELTVHDPLLTGPIFFVNNSGRNKGDLTKQIVSSLNSRRVADIFSTFFVEKIKKYYL